MGVCHKFRNLLLKTRPLTGYAATGQKFTFDVERDTLLVHGMNIPDFLKTPQLPNLHGVRRLVSHLPYTIGWGSYDYLQRTMRGMRHPWAIDAMAHDPLDTAYEESLPFETSFTVAQELGSLCFEHYQDRYEIPMIGLHGYSKTRRDRRNPRQQEYSQGGQWAGFRVYLAMQEVEFRPLTWDEVEHLVHQPKQPENIIRDQTKELPGGAYGWIKVKEYNAATDELWVKQVATTWKMVHASLHQPGDDIEDYIIGPH
ncbi:K P-type ATPase (mediates high-affinity potassium or sodium uptake) [Fusarium tjaetaba]|uniref:K P-type ATPase (Mediates high-affinity potassium or sodium uptake) n=1 Tax=Fusarium tjaetaba TaxID=1567544 RepID=A0A8H5QB43_9HYPO|nr:K P-type ATPase (mediates high-affinity potassium or sodium uptake) [Fusarium tjaetaba]KAF5611534.1 K P-type ATPase (mediates high-affinity potassium or sodium uptake) [Fusarium tjaetaba]